VASTPEGSVDDLASAFPVNDAPLTVRFERGLDAGFVVGRQSGRLFIDRFDHIRPAGNSRSSAGTSLPFHVTTLAVFYRENATVT
jgi:hypothetical protein